MEKLEYMSKEELICYVKRLRVELSKEWNRRVSLEVTLRRIKEDASCIVETVRRSGVI